METVVVTASYVDSRQSFRPEVTLRLPADDVIFEMTLSTGSLDASERKEELRQSLASARRQADRRADLYIYAGRVSRYAELETATLEEILVDTGDRSSINLVAKIAVQDGDGFMDVRHRVQDFVGDIDEAGRTQIRVSEEQFLSLDNPSQYRRQLLERIGEDINMVRGALPTLPFTVFVSGLEEPIVTESVGPLELELYIPYTMDMQLGNGGLGLLDGRG